METLKVAIVGCGHNAKYAHAPAWMDLKTGRWEAPVTTAPPKVMDDLNLLLPPAYMPEISLVSVCGTLRHPERPRELGQRYNARVYFDLDEMLREEDIDILDVVTNPQTHCECVVKGLEAGCHVYCETPFAMTVDEAELMVKTAEKTKMFLGYGENYRFSPHHLYLKSLIGKGELGEPCLINSFGHAATFHHRTELMRYFGGEIISVYAEPTNVKGTVSPVIMKYESGAVGTITGVNMSWQHPLERIDYVGSQGRVTVDEIVGELSYYPNKTGVDREIVLWKPTIFEQQDFGAAFRAALAAFADSVRKGEPPPVTGIDGLRYMQLRAAMEKSKEKGVPIKPY